MLALQLSPNSGYRSSAEAQQPGKVADADARVQQSTELAALVEDFGSRLASSSSELSMQLHSPLAQGVGSPALPLTPFISTGAPLAPFHKTVCGLQVSAWSWRERKRSNIQQSSARSCTAPLAQGAGSPALQLTPFISTGVPGCFVEHETAVCSGAERSRISCQIASPSKPVCSRTAQQHQPQASQPCS